MQNLKSALNLLKLPIKNNRTINNYIKFNFSITNLNRCKNLLSINSKSFLTTNSFKRKEPSGLLSNNSSIKIQFSMKIQVSKDCYILRFLLPDENSSLGANVCQHVFLEAVNPATNHLVKKPYQIISTDEDKGVVDIMIKVYNKKEKNQTDYGFFSNYLSNLEQGQVITLSGPSGNIQYHGNGYFEYNKDGNQIQKRFSKIGMIAGGTGIAPMFQLIQSITNSKLTEKKLGISLIYATRLLEDMAFIEDLANYDAKGKIAFFPVVEMPNTENWTYGSGLISPAMIDNLMPSPRDEEGVILICGPRNMISDHILPMLKLFEYKEENIIVF